MSPKSKEQFEEVRKRSVDAIKQAALELFARNGYHSTSISGIAKEAGISKGLMYNYFESKEALLHAIISEAIAEGERLLQSCLEGATAPFERLEAITNASIQMVQANLHYFKLLTALAFQTDVLTGLEDILRNKEKMAFGIIAELFQEMGVENPLKEAMYYGATLDGMMIHYMSMTDHYPLQEMKKYLLSQYEKYRKP